MSDSVTIKPSIKSATTCMALKSLSRTYNSISPHSGISALGGFSAGILGFLIAYSISTPFLGKTPVAVTLSVMTSFLFLLAGYSVVEGYFISKELNKWECVIHDHEVEVKKTRRNEKLSLHDINRIETEKPFLQRFFDTGNVQLSTPEKEVELEYLNKPEVLQSQLQEMIQEDNSKRNGRPKEDKFNRRSRAFSLKPNVGAGTATNLFISLIITPVIFLGVFVAALLASIQLEGFNGMANIDLILLISSLGAAAITSKFLISDYIRLKSTNYIFKGDVIKKESSHQDEEFLCDDIESISMNESRIESFFGVGTIKISLRDDSSFSIRFIEEPERNLRKVRNLLTT